MKLPGQLCPWRDGRVGLIFFGVNLGVREGVGTESDI